MDKSSTIRLFLAILQSGTRSHFKTVFANGGAFQPSTYKDFDFIQHLTRESFDEAQQRVQPDSGSGQQAFQGSQIRHGCYAAEAGEAYFSGQIAAIAKSQAVIEFQMDGTILTANDLFLKTLGYALDEVKGRHHSIFVEEAFRASPAYREFWAALNRGEYQAAEYKRIGKGGKEVWIQASYNPILDLNGKPFKVVKFATDVTQQKLANANFAGQIAAIAKSQAVIEFQMDGTIVTANDLFPEDSWLHAGRSERSPSQHLRR